MKYILLLLALFLVSESKCQQALKFDYLIHGKVDVNNIEIKKVLNTWLNYLNNNPEIFDKKNEYWNSQERTKYYKYDIASCFLFQFPSKDLLKYFKPNILDIYFDPAKSCYCVKTLYFKDSLESEYAKSNPFAIQKTFIKMDSSGNYKIYDPLMINTSNFKVIKSKYFDLLYDSTKINKINLDIEKSNTFIDSISTFLNKNTIKHRYYLFDTPEDLGEKIGFDFFFAGYTSGVVICEDKLILNGTGKGYYPHEFIHMITGNLKNKFIAEGIATFLGGSKQLSFEENKQQLKQKLIQNINIQAEDIIVKGWGWDVNSNYTFAAIICERIYNKYGNRGLSELCEVGETQNDLINYLSKILNINKQDVLNLILIEFRENK